MRLPVWKQSWPMLSQVGPMCWAQLGSLSSLCWVHVGLCWAYVGPCWALLGAMLGPSLGHLCWNDLKMQFFPPRTPSWSPKLRKNRCFLTSPRWNPLPPKGPKHRKKTMFLNTASKIHRKLQGLQSTRSGLWVNRDGSAAGGAAPITFGYHRRPPARTRARGRRPDSWRATTNQIDCNRFQPWNPPL